MRIIRIDNSDKRSFDQSGIGTIAMVITLMVLGLALLTGFNLLITSWQKSIITEISYYNRYNRAHSSQNWGATQSWAIPTNSWQCQNRTTDQLSACIKKSSLLTDNYTILRGSADGFYLYQLTHYMNGKLEMEKSHWLDYCPERRNYNCD
ncbi:DUF2509 family protein [Orbaceae bacterium ESL0721]|nr:DUF2509 family protein [Orbaceae bacterium ESL0721]